MAVAQGVAESELALAQAGGAPLAALSHADPAVQEERRAWIAALSDPDAAFRAEASPRGSMRRARTSVARRLAWAIEWLIAWTVDLARVAAGAAPGRIPDAARALATLASRVAPVALFGYHRSLLQQRAQLAHPLVPRLVAEALLDRLPGILPDDGRQ